MLQTEPSLKALVYFLLKSVLRTLHFGQTQSEVTFTSVTKFHINFKTRPIHLWNMKEALKHDSYKTTLHVLWKTPSLHDHPWLLYSRSSIGALFCSVAWTSAPWFARQHHLAQGTHSQREPNSRGKAAAAESHSPSTVLHSKKFTEDCIYIFSTSKSTPCLLNQNLPLKVQTKPSILYGLLHPLKSTAFLLPLLFHKQNWCH